MEVNDKEECMVEHHICYKETEGWDETILMPLGEHQALHIKLRKENRCNIPAEKLREISSAASNRTEKAKAQQDIWRSKNQERIKNTIAIWNEKNPDYYKKWNEKNSDYRKEYYQKNKEKIKEYSRKRYARKKMEKDNEL